MQCKLLAVGKARHQNAGDTHTDYALLEMKAMHLKAKHKGAKNPTAKMVEADTYTIFVKFSDVLLRISGITPDRFWLSGSVFVAANQADPTWKLQLPMNADGRIKVCPSRSSSVGCCN